MSDAEPTGIRLGIFGRGRLAGAIEDETGAAEGGSGTLRTVWTLGRDERPPEPPGVDVVIDASVAEAVEGHLDWAISAGVDLVIGATGWDVDGLRERVGDRIGVLVAPNFSLGAALQRRLATLLGGFAGQRAERDPWVAEHHHRHKRDAPSGTARALAEAVLDGCERKREWVLVSGAVEPHQLSVSSVRAGSEFGTHVVGVDAPEEVLEIRHTARSRRAFAVGALEAAAWIRGRSGVHDFDAVVADLLDPLFSRSRGDA